MSIYDKKSVTELLVWNTYPGRGIIIGETPNGQYAVTAYFIMGRSANSRNRIFTRKNGAVYTEAFDPSLVEDPSLIMYAALRQYRNHLIVTNGDQTDTVYEGYQAGRSFEESLRSRTFEPDGPNFTPRISGVVHFTGGDFNYEMSILKSLDEEGGACARYHFEYPAQAGLGHFLHTYVCDGSPIPTFQGEPERVAMEDDFDGFCEHLWDSLDANNKISLYVCYIDKNTGAAKDRLINKNK